MRRREEDVEGIVYLALAAVRSSKETQVLSSVGGAGDALHASNGGSAVLWGVLQKETRGICGEKGFHELVCWT